MRVRYTRTAFAELQSIVSYISLHNPRGARKVHARIRNAIETLTEFPHIGIRTTDPAIRRTLALPYPYAIFYEPTPEEIIIHSVRHARRRPVRTQRRSKDDQ